MRIRYPLLLVAGLLCAAQSQAAGFFDNPAILGGGSVGQLSLTDDNFLSPSNVQTATYTPVVDTRFNGYDAHVAAWDIFVGFEFNRYLSVEAGRLVGGTATQQKSFLLAEDATSAAFGVETTDVKTSAWHGSVIGSWPVNDEVSFFGRLGMTHWQSTIKWNRTNSILDKTTGQETPAIIANLSTPLQADNNGNDPFYGAGVAVNIDSGILRLEYDLSKINGFDSRNIYLSIVWRFRPW